MTSFICRTLIDIAAESAEGKEDRPSTPKDLEAKEKVIKCLENLIKTDAFGKLIETVTEVERTAYHEQQSERTEGKSAYEKIGTVFAK